MPFCDSNLWWLKNSSHADSRYTISGIDVPKVLERLMGERLFNFCSNRRLGPQKKTSGVVWIALVAIVSPVIVGLRTWETRSFIGDDLEVFLRDQDGTYLSSLIDLLGFTSLEKWRPVNNLFLWPSIRLAGNSYEYFWVANHFLMSTLGFVVGLTARGILSESATKIRQWIPLLVVVATTTSPFTFMSRIGVFGFLEIAPIALVVLSFLVLDRTKTFRGVMLASTLSLLAILTHERYLVFPIVLGAVCLTRPIGGIARLGGAAALWGTSLIHFFVTMAVFQNNPLRGGGESAFSESAGRWVLSRLFDSALLLSGVAGGRIVFYGQGESAISWVWKILEPKEVWGMPLRWSSALAVIVLLGVLFCSRRNDVQELRLTGLLGVKNSVLQHKRTLELLSISLVLLVPSATVISRIEARWLFGSFVFALLAIASLANEWRFKTEFGGPILCLFLIIGINVMNQNTFTEHNFFRRNSYSLLEKVENVSSALKSENYRLIVNYDPEYQYLRWSTQGGRLFEMELDKPPKEIFFVEDNGRKSSRCWTDDAMDCLEARVSGEGIASEVLIEVSVASRKREGITSNEP